MTRPPHRNRSANLFAAAEAAFKPLAPPAAERAGRESANVLSRVKNSVSITLDHDLFAHFTAQGPGWQERINQALRRAAGL